jgi:putative SOS response-associated peptidase YedK
VILGRDHEEEWLDPKNTKTEGLSKLLIPCPSAWLDSYEISTLINSPKNNRPEVLEGV